LPSNGIRKAGAGTNGIAVAADQIRGIMVPAFAFIAMAVVLAISKIPGWKRPHPAFDA
jgi:hypothetical protein